MTATLDTANTKPPDHWLDREIVKRVLSGRFHLVHRPLSRAEIKMVFGELLDAMYEAVKTGYPPELTLTTVCTHFGWAGGLQAAVTREVRPGHAERMRRARAEYVGYEAIASGRTVSRRRRKRSDPAAYADRKRWNAYGLPA